MANRPENEYKWTDGLFLKIVNSIVYCLFLGASVYTVTDPESIYSHRKQTYFTPAYWAYAIWPAIHLLLLGYVIYQFFPNGKRIIIDGIGWRFSVLAVLSSAYVAVWSQKLYTVAFVLALVVSSSVSHIFYIIKKQHTGNNVNAELWINFPFSLYHGFMSVQVLVTAFEAFGSDAAVNQASALTQVFVVLAFIILNFTTFTYGFSRTEGNIAASASITISIFAIYVQQTSSDFIHLTAFVFGILSLFPVGKSLFGYFVKFLFRSWRNAMFRPFSSFRIPTLPFESWRTNAKARFTSLRPAGLSVPFISGERTPLLGRIQTFRRTLSGTPIPDTERGEGLPNDSRGSLIPKFPSFRKSRSGGETPSQGEGAPGEHSSASGDGGRPPLLGRLSSLRQSVSPSGTSAQERGDSTVPSTEGGQAPPFLGRLDSIRKSATSVMTLVQEEDNPESRGPILNRIDSVRRTLSGAPTAGESGDAPVSGERSTPRLHGFGSIVKTPSGTAAINEGDTIPLGKDKKGLRLPSLDLDGRSLFGSRTASSSTAVEEVPSHNSTVASAEEAAGPSAEGTIIQPPAEELVREERTIAAAAASSTSAPTVERAPIPKPAEGRAGLLQRLPSVSKMRSNASLNVPSLDEGTDKILGRFSPFRKSRSGTPTNDE